VQPTTTIASISPYIIAVFWLFAAAGTFFYCRYALQIHAPGTPETKEAIKKLWPWYVHQWCFNLIGVAVGWISLWIVLPKAIDILHGRDIDLHFRDYFLFFLGLIGITGHLPMTLFNFSSAPRKLLDKQQIELTVPPRQRSTDRPFNNPKWAIRFSGRHWRAGLVTTTPGIIKLSRLHTPYACVCSKVLSMPRVG
jgi:hypothetical protein